MPNQDNHSITASMSRPREQTFRGDVFAPVAANVLLVGGGTFVISHVIGNALYFQSMQYIFDERTPVFAVAASMGAVAFGVASVLRGLWDEVSALVQTYAERRNRLDVEAYIAEIEEITEHHDLESASLREEIARLNRELHFFKGNRTNQNFVSKEKAPDVDKNLRIKMTPEIEAALKIIDRIPLVGNGNTLSRNQCEMYLGVKNRQWAGAMDLLEGAQVVDRTKRPPVPLMQKESARQALKAYLYALASANAEPEELR